MTTNVFDKHGATLATDSRWSQRQGKWLVYVDDTSLYKIELAPKAVFMFAGRGRRIQEWKEWIKAGAAKDSIPEFEGICLCAVDRQSHELKICENLPIIKDGAVFGGSGAPFAFSCWEVNKDAQLSVESAKKLDPATGGATKYFFLKTEEHNLKDTMFQESTISQVDQAILKRGIVMDTTNPANLAGTAPFKLLSELAATNAEVRDLQSKIEAGELSADAPSDGMYSEWAPEQKARVTVALGEIFGW